MEDLRRILDRMEDKLDSLNVELGEIRLVQNEQALVQVDQAADLKHHIYRTDLSERRIELVENKLIPLIELKSKLDGAFKLIGIVSSGLGLIFGLAKAIEIGIKLI